MHKEILQSIVGVQVFPVISLVLFVLVFAVVLVMVSRMSRAAVERLSGLPFDDGAESPDDRGER